MKTIDIIDCLRIGEVVPKRVLAVLKRAKLIGRYSQWGYLEDTPYTPLIEYKGRYFITKYLDGCFKPYLIKAPIKCYRRRDFMQYISEYSHDLVFDNLFRRADELADKMGIDYKKMLRYLAHKQLGCPHVEFRTKLKPINRTISMYGVIY